jgi:hypothetical protein
MLQMWNNRSKKNRLTDVATLVALVTFFYMYKMDVIRFLLTRWRERENPTIFDIFPRRIIRPCLIRNQIWIRQVSRFYFLFLENIWTKTQQYIIQNRLFKRVVKKKKKQKNLIAV